MTHLPVNKPMNTRHRKFVQAYLDTGNQSEAARIAGYSHKSAAAIGSQLMNRDDIRAAVERGKEAQLQAIELQATGQVARADVLDGLLKEATATGKGTTHAARVSAWRALGEELGMFGKGSADAGRGELTALRIEIVGPDGSSVSVDAGHAKALPEQVT